MTLSSVVSFAAIDFYLQEMKVTVSEPIQSFLYPFHLYRSLTVSRFSFFGSIHNRQDLLDERSGRRKAST
jgi:hypothetical protein